MGKSLLVKRMAKQLQGILKKESKHPICVTIPIHGPDVDLDVVMKDLRNHLESIDPINPPPQIFHFDIAPSVSVLVGMQFNITFL